MPYKVQVKGELHDEWLDVYVDDNKPTTHAGHYQPTFGSRESAQRWIDAADAKGLRKLGQPRVVEA